uniref:Putative secreted protein n=1 Tax=Anopheles darlingi TaxID=43151 RepID=A0A2M4D5Z4_ANODA
MFSSDLLPDTLIAPSQSYLLVVFLFVTSFPLRLQSRLLHSRRRSPVRPVVFTRRRRRCRVGHYPRCTIRKSLSRTSPHVKFLVG